MVQGHPLTIFLWLWDGWRPVYNVRNVNATLSQLDATLSIPFRPICVTDTPDGINCETLPLWDIPFEMAGLNTPTRVLRQGRAMHPRRVHEKKPLRPNSYRRLKLFSQWAAETFPGFVMSTDLDSVIRQDLAPILTMDTDEFRINKGRACPYNGGMWLLKTGSRLKVWEEFGPQSFKITNARGLVGSDQAWLSYILPGEKVWDKKHGVYHYSLSKEGDDMSACRVMFTAGATKPWHQQFGVKFPELHADYMSHFDNANFRHV